MRVGLGVAILMMGVVSYGLFQAPTFWRQGPEYQTATGEQRAFVLNDGSDLIIDTQGAVKVRLERQVRHVELVRGQILVRVAKAPNRPFVVETPDGTATALGTRFVVRRDEMATDVVVIESHVRVCLPRSFEGERCHVLAPGERARLASGEIKLLPHVQPEQAALWSKGWLEVDDREVSAVIAELNRYRDQPIRFDPADVSGLRVSGSYPLRDTQRALDGIVASTPLTVERLADGSLKVRRR
jgi:transmembrane sensor